MTWGATAPGQLEFGAKGVASSHRQTAHGGQSACGGFEFGSGSGKAEDGPLLVPGERQTGMLEELLRRQIVWLPSIEDRLGDIWREIAEADEPSEIGPADP